MSPAANASFIRWLSCARLSEVCDNSLDASSSFCLALPSTLDIEFAVPDRSPPTEVSRAVVDERDDPASVTVEANSSRLGLMFWSYSTLASPRL